MRRIGPVCPPRRGNRDAESHHGVSHDMSPSIPPAVVTHGCSCQPMLGRFLEELGMPDRGKVHHVKDIHRQLLSHPRRTE
jgi:hypothetical protein